MSRLTIFAIATAVNGVAGSGYPPFYGSSSQQFYGHHAPVPPQHFHQGQQQYHQGQQPPLPGQQPPLPAQQPPLPAQQPPFQGKQQRMQAPHSQQGWQTQGAFAPPRYPAPPSPASQMFSGYHQPPMQQSVPQLTGSLRGVQQPTQRAQPVQQAQPNSMQAAQEQMDHQKMTAYYQQMGQQQTQEEQIAQPYAQELEKIQGQLEVKYVTNANVCTPANDQHDEGNAQQRTLSPQNFQPVNDRSDSLPMHSFGVAAVSQNSTEVAADSTAPEGDLPADFKLELPPSGEQSDSKRNVSPTSVAQRGAHEVFGWGAQDIFGDWHKNLTAETLRAEETAWKEEALRKEAEAAAEAARIVEALRAQEAARIQAESDRAQAAEDARRKESEAALAADRRAKLAQEQMLIKQQAQEIAYYNQQQRVNRQQEIQAMPKQTRMERKQARVQAQQQPPRIVSTYYKVRFHDLNGCFTMKDVLDLLTNVLKRFPDPRFTWVVPHVSRVPKAKRGKGKIGKIELESMFDYADIIVASGETADWIVSQFNSAPKHKATKKRLTNEEIKKLFTKFH